MGIATRNNITIYPVTPQGLEARVDISADSPSNWFGVMALEARMDLRALAEITGGVAHLASNDLKTAFERIVKDASTYYRLGFNSDYRKNDGKFVRLDVRVKRPGLTVRTRSGYVSATLREQQQAARKAPNAKSWPPPSTVPTIPPRWSSPSKPRW
jgi:VWFA-related protein